MRSLFVSAIAIGLAAGSLSASAQSTAPAPAPKTKACKGRAEADCVAPDCKWIAASKTTAGKDIKAYCRKVTKAAPKPKT